MSTGIQLHAKLFLEGKEVPLIGATITSSVGQASISYIDMVPHKAINNIKPRTLVHLFTKDFSTPGEENKFVLAFEGEVFGFNFGKTPSSRTFSISCIDLSSYWDNVVSYFFNVQQSLSKGAEGAADAGMDIKENPALAIQTIPVNHAISSYFIQIIKEKTSPTDGGKKGDFLDGFVNVYSKIGKLNDFYNSADERLRIHERIVLKSSGVLEDLLKEDEGIKWFEGVSSHYSGYTTLRLIVQDLMSLIFHDFVAIPFPAKVDSTLIKDKKDGVVSGATVKKTNAQFIFKPNLYMVPPPACNIFFPDEYSSFQYNRNFFQEPTRLIYKPEMPGGQFAQPVKLPHVYAPDSFRAFMFKNSGIKKSDITGSGDVQVDEDFGFYGDKDTNDNSKDASNGFKREWQMLTNEEKMKGMLIAMESMVPAATQFRSSLKDAGKVAFAIGVASYLFYKKRFETREVQITSHLKMSVVPGFTCLILDDSDAEQSVIAYCNSVTHRIYATQGGYTNTNMSYARTVGEQDVASGTTGEPLVPPWFSEAIFGSRIQGEIQVGPRLSEFYASLLGDTGSKTVPDMMSVNTMTAAAKKLSSAYRAQKSKRSPDAMRAFISSFTRRDYVTMSQAFFFLGATTTSDLNSPWLEFFGDNLKAKGQKNANQVAARRAVIDEYRKELKEKRGFRG